MNHLDTAAGAIRAYPMTYEQEALWLDDHLDHKPSRYLESWVYRLRGAVDVAAVERAIGRIVARHESLRSRLTIENDELVQIVLPAQELHLLRKNCRHEDVDDEFCRTIRQPLDLNLSPLRPWLLRLSNKRFSSQYSSITQWSMTGLWRSLTRNSASLIPHLSKAGFQSLRRCLCSSASTLRRSEKQASTMLISRTGVSSCRTCGIQRLLFRRIGHGRQCPIIR